VTDKLFDPETGLLFEDEDEGAESGPDQVPTDTVARLEWELSRVRLDHAGSEREVRRLRRENGALRKELEEKHENSAKRPVAQAIFDLWVELSGRDSRTKLGEKRVKALYARIGEGFDDLDYWRVAIEGFVVGHNVSANGKHYDDLELLARNEVNLERFHREGERLAARPAADGPPPGDEEPPWAL
jgi:hypothetical protein